MVAGIWLKTFRCQGLTRLPVSALWKIKYALSSKDHESCFYITDLISPFCWPDRVTPPEIGNNRHILLTKFRTMVDTRVQQATLISLTHCVFVCNTCIRNLQQMMWNNAYFHGDGVQSLSPKSNNHACITANQLPALSMRGVFLGVHQSLFGCHYQKLRYKSSRFGCAVIFG